MSTILLNFYDKIRADVNASDIVRNYISLNRKGEEYLGICPFHSEKTPSFTVNDKKKFYHCFGCGAHGDCIKFEAEQSGLSYKDAAYKIADKFGVDRPIFTKEQEQEQEKFDRQISLLSEATGFFLSNLDSKIKDILHKRGISDEMILKYRIGYTGPKGALLEYFSKKNVRLDELETCGLLAKNSDGKYYEIFRERIIIPIISAFGKVIAFGGRSITNEMPKYLNSPETIFFKKGETLYGEDIANSAAYKTGRTILVEGYFDAIAMHKAGFLESVASLGTAVTTNHLQKLWKVAREIIVCLDGDEAGIRASKKLLANAISMVSSQNTISFIILPKKLDPDSLLQKYGLKSVASAIENRMSFSEYIFYSLSNEQSFSSPEEKAKLEIELNDYTSKINDAFLRKNVSTFFKNKCWELFNHKQFSLKKKKQPLLIDSKTSQLENIENLIVCFLVLHAKEFSAEDIQNALLDISQTNNQLKNLIETILYIIDKRDSNMPVDIISELKKTSFSEQFELLCARYKGSIPAIDYKVNKKQILEFLLARKYLVYLTNEFSSLVKNDDSKLESRLKFYLEEINHTKDKIEKFNMLITNK